MEIKKNLYLNIELIRKGLSRKQTLRKDRAEGNNLIVEFA